MYIMNMYLIKGHSCMGHNYSLNFKSLLIMWLYSCRIIGAGS